MNKASAARVGRRELRPRPARRHVAAGPSEPDSSEAGPLAPAWSLAG